MRGKRDPDCDIDLGLAVSALSLVPGQTRTLFELAAFCGCSTQQIADIEHKALRKIRNRPADMAELLEHFEGLQTTRTSGGKHNGIATATVATVPDAPPHDIFDHRGKRAWKAELVMQIIERELCPA